MKWQKGVSGNVRGRPKKGHSLSDALERAVNTDELAQIIWRRAKEGEQWAVVLLANKLMPTDSLQRIAATEGRDVRIEVTYVSQQLSVTGNVPKAIDAAG